MSVPNKIVAAWSAFAFIVAGCAAHESVGRPPSPGEIERINAFARDHGRMQVEYVDPLVPCAAGACGAGELTAAQQGNLVVDPVGIEWSAERQTSFFTKAERRAIPTPAVAAVSVLDRGRGAEVGAVIGLAVGLLFGLFAASISINPDASDPPPPCDMCKERVMLIVGAEGVLVGAGLGYLIGSRHIFEFDAAGPRPPSPPRQTTERSDGW